MCVYGVMCALMIGPSKGCGGVLVERGRERCVDACGER